MVDIEFITQFYILAYSYKYTELKENLGNIKLLSKIADLGLINKKQANDLIAAYRDFRRKQHQQGLNPKSPGKVSKTIVVEHYVNVERIWSKFCEKI